MYATFARRGLRKGYVMRIGATYCALTKMYAMHIGATYCCLLMFLHVHVGKNMADTLREGYDE